MWTLVPFLKTMEEKLGFRYPSVTADSGYESEEGYTYLREQNQKAYIKPQTYEKWKKRSFKQDISKRENMGYDESTDTYTCHAEKKLKPVFVKKQKSKSGYESEVTVYECEECTGCPHKEKCTRAKGNKRLYISKSFLEKRQESYENILSEKGILYRMNRSIQVEGAFGVLKHDYEFQRFLLRGKAKVKLEILLLRLRFIRKTHCQKDFMLWRGSARLGGVSGVDFNVLGNLAELVRKLKVNADIAVFVNLDMVYQFNQNFAGQLFDVLIFCKSYQRGMLLVNAV